MIDHRLVIVCVCWTWMFLEAIESAATLDLTAMEWPHSCPLCWAYSLAHQKRAHPTPYPLCWVCHLAHKNGLAWRLITQHNGHWLVDHSIVPKRRKVEDGEQFGSSSELEFLKCCWHHFNLSWGFGCCRVSQQCNQIHSQRWSDDSSPNRVSWSQLGQGKDDERPAILSLARKPKITSLWLTPQATADAAAIQFDTFSWSQGLCGFPEWVVNKSHSNFWRGRNHLALLRCTRHRYRYPRCAWCVF